MENRAGKNSINGIVNNTVVVCGSCLKPLCGSIEGKDYLKIRFRKARLIR